jgi:PAS domain S-box-containing protein
MAPGIISQMSVILTAGFLLGWKGGALFGILTIGTDLGFAYLEIAGQLPTPQVVHNPMTRWIGAIIPFGTILALQYYATNHLRTSLEALEKEVQRRKAAEQVKDDTVYNLNERVKELKTLYGVSRLLQQGKLGESKIYQAIAELIPYGWQFPEITAAIVRIGDRCYSTENYEKSKDHLVSRSVTSKGTTVCIEVVYLSEKPPKDEGPFLKEERHLIDMLVEMINADLERNERANELQDYKFALDTAAIVAISDIDGRFTFVNENFCAVSKYDRNELLNKHHSILFSGYHAENYFDELKRFMLAGEPYRGEFCNKAKDGSLYWVDTTIVPFLDVDGNLYQYLSINQDITERKLADEKIRQNEQQLRKITSQVPGNTYVFSIDETGGTSVLFMNRGTDIFNHKFSSEEIIENPLILRDILHPDDKETFNEVMKSARATQSKISFQYRMIIAGHVRWRWMQAVPEKREDGDYIWYGATSDITPLIEHITSIEQMVFDISHVIRRPISTMLGMTEMIMDSDLSEKEMKNYGQMLHNISKEMDEFIKTLNQAYNEKKESSRFSIDVSSSIDKRNELFK